MTKDDYDLIKVDEWNCPEGTGVPILVMPNIPRALHGKGLQPRTVYGKTTWDFMRKRAYYNANYKCEICGCEPERGKLHSHELFSYDYRKQEGVFERCVAICADCHNFIHSGRLLSMFNRGNPLYPKSYILKVAEHGLKLVHEYNKEHPDDEKRVYDTWLNYLRNTEIKDEMIKLFEKYETKFYTDNTPSKLRWKGWHVIIGNKRINSPYKKQSDWEQAMLQMAIQDNIRQAEEAPFKGKVFDDIDKILSIEKEDQD